MLCKTVAGVAIAVILSALVPTPASAHTEACAFTGTMTISPSTGTTVSWWMSMVAGACTATPLFAASGDMTFPGVGTMTGTGVSHLGHRFAFTGISAVFVVAGEVTGTFWGFDDPTSSGPTAIVNATFYLTH